MSKFAQYRTFVAVAETGSLTAASRALHLTASAVSKQLTTLERGLDVTLVERTNKRISLTGEGQAFYLECVEILRAIEKAEETVKQSHQQINGQLTISYPNSLAHAHCFRLFAEFSRRHPDIRLEIRLTDDIETLLHNKIDFAFRLGADPAINRLEATALCKVNLIMCAAPSYIQTQGILHDVDEISNHRFVLTRPAHVSQPLKTYLKEHRLTFDKSNTHITDDGEATYQLVKHGCGVGLFLDLNVDGDLATGVLMNAFPDSKLLSKELFLVSKKQTPSTRKHQTFLSFVEAFFRATQAEQA